MPRHRSRGIVLFVALLVMVALSIAGVALMRSTDAATAVTAISC
jgi:Tfp pilus assembly protein PilX